MTRHARGFTLLELLIAIGIFAFVSVMAFSGLRAVLDARQETTRQAERLAELERALLFLGRDLTQVARRPVRDELGDVLPALSSGAGYEGLELTRAGASGSTLAGAARSGLQRVGWQLREGVLERITWPVLDRAQDSEPYRAPLMGEVMEFEVRFLDPTRAWAETWPPAQAQPTQLPLAVQVFIELEDWGGITRVWALPGGGT